MQQHNLYLQVCKIQYISADWLHLAGLLPPPGAEPAASPRDSQKQSVNLSFCVLICEFFILAVYIFGKFGFYHKLSCIFFVANTKIYS